MARSEFYAAIEPYESGLLPLDGPHRMYWRAEHALRSQ